jgi:hypothetical protein
MKCSMVVSAFLAVAFALLAFAAAAGAVPTLTPLRTVPMPASVSYAPAPDGTFWATRPGGSSEGKVFHLGAAGETLGEWTINRAYFHPLSIGYYGGEVYIASPTSFENQLFAWPVGSIGTSTPTVADEETEMKFGSVQFIFRIDSAGAITAEFGQDDEIGLLNGAAVSGGHPYYAQTFMGAGINGNPVVGATPFETCGSAVAETNPCGHYSGVTSDPRWGTQGLSDPDDAAPLGSEGLYVTEYEGYEYGSSIALISTGGGAPYVKSRFGTPAEISRPRSIVREPATGDLYVSEEGNRRIDVFSGAGEFLGAFGYGVLDGADTFESCGLEIGPCQAGISYSTDTRSYFDRLDLGPEGDLYAYEPLANQIEVFGLGTAAGKGGGGSTGTGGGTTPITTPIATKPPVVTPFKCPKGKVLKKVKGVKKCLKKPKHHKHAKKKHHRHKHP